MLRKILPTETFSEGQNPKTEPITKLKPNRTKQDRERKTPQKILKAVQKPIWNIGIQRIYTFGLRTISFSFLTATKPKWCLSDKFILFSLLLRTIHFHIIIFNLDQWSITLNITSLKLCNNLLGLSIFTLFTSVFCRLRIHVFCSFICIFQFYLKNKMIFPWGQ